MNTILTEEDEAHFSRGIGVIVGVLVLLCLAQC